MESRTSTQHTKIVVAVALLRRRPGLEAELFIARRTSPESVAGMWEFPGGKLEPGETLHEGLHRELLEELGVSVVLHEEIVGGGHASFSPESGWWLKETTAMRLFRGELVDGEPFPLQDHDRVDWVPVTPRLLDYAWIPADRPIVEQILRDVSV
ncbi:(deoxy)nucleoside triphosphate pyrophosphohydrolase [Nesterenkonia lutea]|uniref:8-oxo-dGTP diphosphatase n=1 Tax=Nesterenkonia lutea TaxID=272919 RepID=A0ABR9JCA9_9MICC|nr:NUDIX domain-containing protein [Nesterenkonia lutea]MBE1523555.1 8-oxo-dGTP diphosphatase [Nesterenkonia lutea]